MIEIIQQVNDILWTYIVLGLLVGCAIYFTIRLRGMQFVQIPEMLRQFTKAYSNMVDEEMDTSVAHKKVSSFQAFAVSLSSRVGTGNLAGVASAIFVGGPGAVFWMWVMALFGSATSFVESTLAQLYKRKGTDSFYGGPAYYMLFGLHRRWMGILFAVLITLTFGMANQAVQSTTLCDAVSDFFGISKLGVGVLLTGLTMVIVFGGVRRVSQFSAVVVPFMAIGYILIAFYVVFSNIMLIPSVIRLIVESAFGVEQAAGGMVGVAVMQGVKRGLFSNEAGEGSAPNAAAIANTSHPVKQGFLQAFGVFTDTLIICTCTAAIVLIAGNYGSGKDGILLTAESLEMTVGPIGRYFIVAAIVLFAFSTIVANCFYGETNVRFIAPGNTKAVQLFRLFSCGLVLIGSAVSLQTTWVFVDLVMGCMTICNLAAIIQLFPKVKRLYDNYMQQLKEGKHPVFKRDMMPDIAADLDAWE